MDHKFTRRECILFGVSTALVFPIAALAKAPFQTQVFSDEMTACLIAVVATVTPLNDYNDMYYHEVVQKFDQIASSNDRVLELIKEGCRELDSFYGKRFATSDLDERLTALKSINSQQFRAFVTNPALGVYNLPLVWRTVGYEGPSYEEGGYLNRGFNDLGWLSSDRGAVQ